jgi:hypothetical protein
MTSTALMGTALPRRMTIGAGFTAVGLTVFHYRIAEGNDAQTGFTGTFHLSHGSHDMSPLV